MLVDPAISLIAGVVVYGLGCILFGLKREKVWLIFGVAAILFTFVWLKTDCDRAVSEQTWGCLPEPQFLHAETKPERMWRRFTRESNWTFP